MLSSPPLRSGGSGSTRAVTPAHGQLSTHRAARDSRRFPHEAPFPLTLVFNESDYEYTHPFYYGRYASTSVAGDVSEDDLVRFTQSPSGGGAGNLAWDFQWFIETPQEDQVYRLLMRAAHKPWSGREDILQV